MRKFNPIRVQSPLGDNPPYADLYYGFHAIEALKKLPADSIQTCVTSPPYFGLRDYGTEPYIWGGDDFCVHVWGDENIIKKGHPGNKSTLVGPQTAGLAKEATSQGMYCQKCGAWKGQTGLEPTPELYIEHMVDVFREVRRVLRPDGTLWLNIGDSFARQGGDASGVARHWDGRDISKERETSIQKIRTSSKNKDYGDIKPKDMIGIPWMLAFALRSDGWYLRSDIIWEKPNAMPEPVKDRPSTSYEHVFFLTKSSRYYYDIDAIRTPHNPKHFYNRGADTYQNAKAVVNKHRDSSFVKRYSGKAHGNPKGKNKRDIWTIPVGSYKGAHFATMPEKLAETCVKAGGRKGCIALDPFSGSATTGVVAMRLGMNYVGIDLNKEYLPLAEARLLGQKAPQTDDDCDDDIFDLFGDDDE